MTRVQRMAAVITGIVMTATGSGVGFYNYKRTLPHAPEAVEVVQAPAPAVVPPPPPVVQPAIGCNTSREYTVVKGDTLTGIAIAQWGPGNAFQYRMIWHDNADKVKNPNRIYPRQVLTIKDCIEKDTTPTKVVSPRVKKEKRHHVSSRSPKPKAPAAAQSSAPPSPNTPSQAQVTTPSPEPTQSVRQPEVVQEPPAVIQRAEPTPPTVPAPQTREGIITPTPPQTPPAPEVVDSKPTTIAVNELHSPVLLPGAAWDAVSVMPVESGNVINQLHVEQGVSLGRFASLRFIPIVSGDIIQDRDEYPWDNKARGAAFARLQKVFALGVMNIDAGYGIEQLQKTSKTPKKTATGFIGSVNGWLGWKQPSTFGNGGFGLRSAPGTVNFAVGYLSPFEKGNIIGYARADQGVILAKKKHFDIGPAVWGQAGFDTKGNPWNDRYTLGYGGLLAIPWGTGVLKVEGGDECTRELRGVKGAAISACGPAAVVSIWTGWHTIGGGKR